MEIFSFLASFSWVSRESGSGADPQDELERVNAESSEEIKAMSRKAIEQLFHHIKKRPEAAGFFLGEEVRTFGELEERGRRYGAALMQRGVEKGDRVVSILESSLELVEVLLGHHLIGAIHVPVNTRYREKEIGHILEDAAPKAVVVGASMAARAILERIEMPGSVEFVVVVEDQVQEPGGGEEGKRAALKPGEVEYEEFLESRAREEFQAPELCDDDLALFIYTSGTTGPSKGVEHTYGSVVAGIDALTRHWEWTPEDRLVLALPLFHVHGLCIGVHGTLLRGNQTEIQRGFDPRRAAEAVGAGGTIFMGVPMMHGRLVAAMEEDRKLAEAMRGARLITSGSAALRPDLFRRYEELTGHRVLERYGMSETMLTISNPYRGERRPGAVGFAVPGTTVRIVNEEGKEAAPGELGEVQVKGPSVMRGYWGLEDKTAEAFTEDGFFRTGDVGLVDEEGYIRLRGRRSVDIIKSGGFKISAREIEEVLQEHPDVEEIALVGIPCAEFGERIAAAVVPKKGGARSEEEWLESLADPRLASFKKPRGVMIFEEGLPRNALGKVQKHRIIEEMSR